MRAVPQGTKRASRAAYANFYLFGALGTNSPIRPHLAPVVPHPYVVRPHGILRLSPSLSVRLGDSRMPPDDASWLLTGRLKRRAPTETTDQRVDTGGFCITCIRQEVVAHELERVCLTSIREAHTRRVQQSLWLARRREDSCATCCCPIQVMQKPPMSYFYTYPAYTPQEPSGRR